MELGVIGFIFSALSLYFNGYVLKFNRLDSLVRGFCKSRSCNKVAQRKILLLRVKMIKYVHLMIILSLISNTFSIAFLFFKQDRMGNSFFFLAMFFFFSSALAGGIELFYSTKAINLELEDV